MSWCSTTSTSRWASRPRRESPLSKLTPRASWDDLPKRAERFNLNGAKNPFVHMPDRPVISYGSVTLESSPAEVAVLNEENSINFAVPRNTTLLTLEAWTSPRSLGGAYPDQALLTISFNPAPPMSVWHVWEADGTTGGTFDAWLYDEYTEPSGAIREPSFYFGPLTRSSHPRSSGRLQHAHQVERPTQCLPHPRKRHLLRRDVGCSSIPTLTASDQVPQGGGPVEELSNLTRTQPTRQAPVRSRDGWPAPLPCS